MKIQEMKKEDFETVKQIGLYEKLPKANSIVIIPRQEIHDSGYAMIDLVLVGKNSEPLCRVSRGSDIIHIDGIGDYGKTDYSYSRLIECKGWRIDCLPCGYFRIFTGNELEVGYGISDIEIYADVKK